MTAKEYLIRYRDAVRESREIELKITQLRLRYGAPSAINYSDMPKAHNSERDLSDYMEKLEELTDTLYSKYERCLGIMVDIEMRLDQMAGPNAQLEREILRHRYTDITEDGKLSPWENVAGAVHYSDRTVRRVHGTALQHFPYKDDERHMTLHNNS